MVGDQGSAAVEYIICICCNVYIRLGFEYRHAAVALGGLEVTFSTVELEVPVQSWHCSEILHFFHDPFSQKISK